MNTKHRRREEKSLRGGKRQFKRRSRDAEMALKKLSCVVAEVKLMRGGEGKGASSSIHNQK